MATASSAPDPSGPDGAPERDAGRATEIIRAAARIFAEKGYHATSIHEIAAAVHLTKAGLYYYIKGKRDLLYRIMEFALDSLEHEVVAVAQEEQDLVRRLRCTVERHALLIIEGREELSILVNELEGLTPEEQRTIKARQRRYVHFIRDTLEALRAEGKLAAIDSTAGAFAIIGMVLWLSRWYSPRGPMKPERLVSEMAEIALGGVLGPHVHTRQRKTT